MMLHAISVDVEDWYQSTIDETVELSDRFEGSTQSVLEAFAVADVIGTFFILGLVAEKAPHLVRGIAQAGHEVQSHGYGHRSNFDLTAQQLRQDLLRAKGLIEDITGQAVYGYRAPCFTIDERNMWALGVLAETGHLYDSSIFPLKTSRYGVDNYCPEAQVVTAPNGLRIIEAPVACFDWMGRRYPVGGGGYFRLWPYVMIRRAWRQLESRRMPGIVYMHPYEYDPVEMDVYQGNVSLPRRMQQGIGRRGFPRKIDRLLREFRFGPMKEVLSPLLKDIEHENSHPDR